MQPQSIQQHVIYSSSPKLDLRPVYLHSVSITLHDTNYSFLNQKPKNQKKGNKNKNRRFNLRNKKKDQEKSRIHTEFI